MLLHWALTTAKCYRIHFAYKTRWGIKEVLRAEAEANKIGGCEAEDLRLFYGAC